MKENTPKKDLAVKIVETIINIFVAICTAPLVVWKKCRDADPNDTPRQQFTLFLIALFFGCIAIGAVGYGVCYLEKKYNIVERILPDKPKRSHRPHITRTVEPQKVEVPDVGQTEN